jgi:hypothetical protein
MKKQGIKILLVTVLVLGLMQTALAEEKEIKKTAVTKQITGEVSAVMKDFIAIVYERDEKNGTEKEMALPIDTEALKVERKAGIGEVQVGDTVTVKYEETTEEAQEGKKISRKAKVIRFIKPAPAQPQAYEPEEGALTSE